MNKKDFPVKLYNKGCYLKEIKYKASQASQSGKFWEGLFVSFVDKPNSESSKYLNEAFFNPQKENYEDQEKYLRAKLRVVKSIEHLASVYLTSKEMLDVFFPEVPESSNPAGKENLPRNKFKECCDRLIEVLKTKKAEKIPVDLKTVSWQGKVKLGSPAFIRRSGDNSKTFKYYDNELN